MLRFDDHIHHCAGEGCGSELLEKMNRAGFGGGAVLSESPIASLEDGSVLAPRERIDRVMRYCKGCDTLYPFFFIDPTEKDALTQVDMALDAGICGFKTICTHFYPGDERAMPVYHKVAQSGKPYLFHSGILYDGINASGNYNRPCGFEALLSVPGLRFAMAHISWPWCDECIAVYGKFSDYLSRGGADNAPELFIDITPGTPPLYRKDALAKLLAMPGAIDHINWGADNHTLRYDDDYALRIRTRDDEIFRELGLHPSDTEKIYAKNFLRFITGDAASDRA